MVLVRRIHNRGANIVVEANGEVLFLPTGDVANWQRRFSARVREFSAAEAPVNKRPRWAHYGKPLKTTFTASTTLQPGRMRVYSAVGSTSPHAYYVDQGTGVFNGSSPWKAKILPPTHRGGPNLYEATWRPAPGAPQVGSVYIKGQKGQHFFDKGLKRAFQSMRLRSFQVPGEGRITEALNSVPTGLLGFLGNTAATPAFVAQLEEWRAWRDAAWRSNRDLRTGQRYRSPRELARQARVSQRRQARREAYKERERLRSKRNREIARATKDHTAKNKPRKPRLSGIQKARAAARAEMQRFFMKHPGFRLAEIAEHQGGFYYFDGGRRHFHAFSLGTADLFANAGVQFVAPPKHT